jgi:parallel beta-helix repeat protein
VRHHPIQLIALLLTTSAWAETFTVDDGGDISNPDFTDIQSAIDAASDGDTVLVYPGTYTWNGTGNGESVIDTLGKAITVKGRLTPDSVFIDGEGVRTGVLCQTNEGPQTNIVNFTVQNCNSIDGAGINLANTSPTIANCIITGNTASSLGAGIYVAGGTPTITGCQISNNHAGNSGGGIRTNFLGYPLLSQTILCGNTPDQVHGGWTNGGDVCLTYDCTDSDSDGWPDKCSPVGDGVHHVPAEYPTIQAAINAAGYGDEVIVAPGTWYGSGSAAAVIDPGGKQLYIHSSGGSAVTTIHGEGIRRCVQCVNGESNATIIEGFTLGAGVNSNGGGGLYCFESTPQLVDCVVGWCNGGTFGGGIYVALSASNNGQVPIIHGCLITQNYAATSGSGMYVVSYGGEVQVQDTTFCGNYGNQVHGPWYDVGGNCIAYACDDDDGDGTPDKCFSIGDGVHHVPADYPTIAAAIEAAGNGDQVVVAPGTYGPSELPINPIGKRLHIRSSDGAETTILSGGGVTRGIYCQSGETNQTTIEGFTFKDCNALAGACGALMNSSPNIVDCIFQSNVDGTYGGGLYLSNSQTAISGCEFSYLSGVYGGAICALNSNFTVTDSTFGLCTADNGAAVFLYGESHGAFQDCLSGFNIADSSGGMAYVAALSSITFTDCTVGLSSAPVGPGIAAAHGSSINFEGINACAGTWCGDPNSTVAFATDAVTTVDEDITLSPEGAAIMDLHDLSLASRLTVDGTLYRSGSLCITNESGSLSSAILGELYPIVQAAQVDGTFSSVVLPVMPEGLGLQLIEQTSVAGGGDTELALVVVEVDDIDFTSPFTGDLESPPVDMESIDIDGDGTDELAVLFGGTPGGVAVYTISADVAPVIITTLTTVVGNDPVDLAVADLDSDGHDDLVVTNGADNTLSIMLVDTNNSGAPILTLTEVDVPGYGQTLTCGAIIDWDHNGIPDIVVGIDRDNPNNLDAVQLVLDITSDPVVVGPLYDIPMYELAGEFGGTVLLSDPPTAASGGGDSTSFGFVFGTRYGRISYGSIKGSGLTTLVELGGTAIVTIEAIDLDADDALDILAASTESQSLYLLPGDGAFPGVYEALIPISVDEPVVDVLALDVDNDGDMDLVIASPDAVEHPMLLLRNDDPPGALQPLGTRVWSKQAINGGSPKSVTSGTLNNMDEDDDWVMGGGGGSGLIGDDGGAMDQILFTREIIPGDQCIDAIDAVLGPQAFDTTSMTASDFGDPDEDLCTDSYLGWSNSPDVWYRWPVPSTGTVTFTTCDSNSFDTSIVLYKGATCDALVQISCNGDATTDPDCQSYYAALFDLSVTQGQTMYIRIGGWQGGTGNGTLTIDFTSNCPEDIDGNGTVNIDDLLLVLGNFNGTGQGDVDNNGVVDIDDLLLVIGAWGTDC